MSLLLLSFVKIKASLHMAAISGLTVFIFALSMHFTKNLNAVIAVLIFLNGLLASSRLHLKAHNKSELIFGFFLGAIPHFILMGYWV